MTTTNGNVDRIAQLRQYGEIRQHVLDSGDADAIRRMERREQLAYNEAFWAQKLPTPSEQLRSALEDR